MPGEVHQRAARIAHNMVDFRCRFKLTLTELVTDGID
jgi:hypothetical protein